jgi:hypothetical protein
LENTTSDLSHPLGIRNDRRDAGESAENAQSGDLIPGSPGYFSTPVFEKCAANQAFSLFRLDCGTNVYDKNCQLLCFRDIYRQITVRGCLKSQAASFFYLIRSKKSKKTCKNVWLLAGFFVYLHLIINHIIICKGLYSNSIIKGLTACSQSGWTRKSLPIRPHDRSVKQLTSSILAGLLILTKVAELPPATRE